MIRVCHLGKYYPPHHGGMESHVQTLARAQAELGAQVQVLCVNHRPGPTREEMDGPVQVVRLERVGSALKLDFCPELVAELSQVAADILHVHVPNPMMILGVLLARPRMPVVVTYHSDHVRQRVRRLLFRRLERRFYRRVRAIIATSPNYAAGSDFLGPYMDRVHVIPHGIDTRPYAEPCAEDRAEAERIRARYPAPIWLSCGRLIYYKGLVHAVRAMTNVPGTLLVIGDGPERLRLELESESVGVADRVVFLGSVRSVIPYYLAAYAFWFPSNARSEAFGLVQVEAMAAGCPVINAAIPASGVPWVNRHDETGLTVPMNDASALATAAKRLSSEAGTHANFAAAARERVLCEFDHRVMARRTLSVYQRILALAPHVPSLGARSEPPRSSRTAPT